MSPDTIQMMWVQNHLPKLSRVCIESFIRCGHPVRLYCYDGCDWSHPGLEVANAADVLPKDKIFVPLKGHGKDSLSVFSDLFRYKLLNDYGGWWVDTDTYCLRPFDFGAPVVISRDGIEPWRLVTTPFKAPRGLDFVAEALRVSENAPKDRIIWNELGCQLLCKLGAKYRNMQQYGVPHEIFQPWGFTTMGQMIDRPRLLDVLPTTKALHVFNEVWRRQERDTDGTFAIHGALAELAARVSAQDKVWGPINPPISAITGDFNQDVTFAVKTFNRGSLLLRMLQSIRKFYPRVRILIADDGDQPIPAEVTRDKDTSVCKLPFNSGLSAGRNFLVDHITTPFFMLLDDDYVFTEETDLMVLYKTLLNTDATLAGGAAADRYTPTNFVYTGTMTIASNTLTITSGKRGGDEEHWDVDLLPNFFMGRTAVIRDVHWDDHIKIGWEHADFFLKLLGRYKSIYCPKVRVIHDAGVSKNDPQYAKYRWQSVNLAQRYLMDKWGLRSINSFGRTLAYPQDATYPGQDELARENIAALGGKVTVAPRTPIPSASPVIPARRPSRLLFDPRPPSPGQSPFKPSQDTRIPRPRLVGKVEFTHAATRNDPPR